MLVRRELAETVILKDGIGLCPILALIERYRSRRNPGWDRALPDPRLD